MPSRGGGGLRVAQMITVAFAFLVASFVVFVFGMWVGKDVAERRLAQEERVIRAPVSRSTPQENAPDPDITFYERLRESGTPSPPSQPEAARITVAPPPTPTIVVIFHSTTLERATPTVRKTPARVAPSPRETAAEWADAGWTVQVSATTDGHDAAMEVARLKAKGYDAYTVPAPLRGQTWYRVRVGRYATRESAMEVETRLKAAGMTNAFVTAR